MHWQVNPDWRAWDRQGRLPERPESHPYRRQRLPVEIISRAVRRSHLFGLSLIYSADCNKTSAHKMLTCAENDCSLAGQNGCFISPDSFANNHTGTVTVKDAIATPASISR